MTEQSPSGSKIEGLREKALAATRGEWSEWTAPDTGQHFVRTVYVDAMKRRCTAWPVLCDAGGQDNAANAAYIVAAQPSTVLALIDRIEALETDKARLDYLDQCNAALNAAYGTKYGWELVRTHNVTRLMLPRMVVDLNDMAANGLPSCRDAIDLARTTLSGDTK